MSPNYSFSAKLWIYSGEGAWYFVTLPKEYIEEIKAMSEQTKRGFGSLRVEAKIGNSKWKTSRRLRKFAIIKT